MNRTYHLSEFLKGLKLALDYLEETECPIECIDSVKYAYSIVDSYLNLYGDNGEITILYSKEMVENMFSEKQDFSEITKFIKETDDGETEQMEDRR